jgi:hypothetical protein
MKNKYKLLAAALLALIITSIAQACSRPKDGVVVVKEIQEGFSYVPDAAKNPFDRTEVPPIYWVIIRHDDGSRSSHGLSDSNRWAQIRDGERWSP